MSNFYDLIHDDLPYKAIEVFFQSKLAKDVRAQYMLAICYLNTHQFSLGVEVLENLLQETVNAEILSLAGWLAYNSGNLNQSRALSKKSIRLRQDWDTYRLLGMSYYLLGNYWSSVRCLSKSLSLSRSFETLHSLGSSLLALEEPEKAIKAFKASLLLGEHYLAYSGLGTGLLRMGRLKESERAIKHALRINSNHASSILLAEVQLKLGDIDQSLLICLFAIYSHKFEEPNLYGLIQSKYLSRLGLQEENP